ncbi:MAG: ATP-dependent helicase [Eubacterium sp.]|nr:ATP-dependent helicase [Eubacterium sp.]
MSARFNKEQLMAVTHKEGPAMVLAGPGSGKTLVITYRVKWLIKECGIDPSHILVITFTRAAADEMKRRFSRFDGLSDAPVTFGTFHSVFFMILRYAYRFTGANIIREDTRRRFIKEMTDGLDLELEDENDFISGLLGEISRVKGEMIEPSLYHSSNCADELFLKIYQGYENKLRENRLLDFDDMLVFSYELLKEREDIREMWQKRFRYILIDEFQDINKVQYEIVKLLTDERRNLFIVGDDDQSIYRFRGARPEIMLGFEKDFPGTRKITLGINYRCSQEIVECAKRLISNNTKRFKKDLRAARGSKSPVVYRRLESVSEECGDIIQGIRFYQSKGISLEEMAVIFRTNTQPRLLVGRLMEYNIPFQMKDLLPNIFDHWIAKNIRAYLDMAAGNMERSTFLQVMNRPKRYIGRKMLEESRVDLARLKGQCFGKKWLYEKIDKLEMDLLLLGKMEPYEAIEYIRKGIGYEDYLAEYAQFRRMNPEDLSEILDQIQESARDYHTREEWYNYIEEYGEELKRQTEAGRHEEKEGVTLTTMHSSKGLEYEVVFVMDLNEGISPHKKAVKDADLEEERRLVYVALTRARTYLFLYSVKELFQKQARVSRYIKEIRCKENEFEPGCRVIHKKLGSGTVARVTEQKISIRFDGKKELKTFSLSYILDNDMLKKE